MSGAAVPFPLWQGEQSGCAPQDSKELNNFGGESQMGLQCLPEGQEENVFDLYQFINDSLDRFEFCVALGARQDNSCHVQQVKLPWNLLAH